MENRITKLFASGKENVLNIFFTAGYPALEDTRVILKSLQKNGVDMVEIGMPYSDPLAEGPVIQGASEQALKNGMSIDKLFAQLEGMREEIDMPILLMGYINPVIQYGIEKFLKKAEEVGVDGVILPDLPFYEYQTMYRKTFEARNLSNIFLVTPQTEDKRLKEIDEASNGFVYVVSTNSTTGNAAKGIEGMTSYFDRIKSARLKSPTLIGFNVRDKGSFDSACEYADGAIIGSAFVNDLSKHDVLDEGISAFVERIKG
jgi:tryptophan synthase alpha chain